MPDNERELNEGSGKNDLVVEQSLVAMENCLSTRTRAEDRRRSLGRGSEKGGATKASRGQDRIEEHRRSGGQEDRRMDVRGAVRRTAYRGVQEALAWLGCRCMYD